MPEKIKELLVLLKSAKAINLIVLLFIVAAIPLTVFIAQKQQEIRQRASSASPSIFSKAAKFASGEFYISTEKSRSQNFGLLNPKGPMTLEAWIRIDEPIASEGSYLIYKLADYNYPTGKTTSAIYYLQYYQNQFRVLITDTDKNLKGFSTADMSQQDVVGVWNHVAGVYDGQKVRIFVNGVEKGSGTMEQSYPLLDDSLPFYIASSPYLSAKKTIPVTLDEVRISNIARYTSNFSLAILPFVSDLNTSLLWHLDGSELGDFETVKDSSGKGNDGIVTGNTPTDKTNIQFVDSTIVILTPTPTVSQSESNKAVYLGDDSYIKVVDNNQKLAMTRDFTIEAWVKPQAGTGPQAILGRLSSTYGRRYLFAVSTNSENKAALHFLNPNQGTRSEFIMPVDTWSHIAAVQKDNTITGFINGEKVFEKTDISPNLSDENNSSTVIGAWINTSNNFISQYFKGGIDDLRVSNIARDIMRNWNNGVYAKPLVSDQNTLVLWHFDNNLNDEGNHFGTETVGNISYIDKPLITPTPPTSSPAYGNAVFLAANNFTDGSYVRPLQTHTIGNFKNATWEAWVKLKERPGVLQYPILSKRFLGGASGDNFSYMLELTPARKLKFTYSIMYQNRWAPTEIVSNSTVNPDTWTHVAVVYNNVSLSEGEGKLRLYINGKIDAENLQTGSIGGGSETTYGDDVFIGTDPSGTYSFNGFIDEVRISNTPRYIGSTIAPSRPFTMNSDTLLLCHFDESNGNPVCVSASRPTIDTFSKNIQFITSTISGYSYTITPTPTPFVCTACSADIDKSGRVDNIDYQRFMACLGKKSTETDALRRSCAPSDIDKSGIVGTADYNCLIQKFYQTCSSTFLTPTPFIFPTTPNVSSTPLPTKAILK